MITAERVRHSGAIILTALVTDGRDRFYKSHTFYSYPIRAAKTEFRDIIASEGLRIVKAGYMD